MTVVLLLIANADKPPSPASRTVAVNGALKKVSRTATATALSASVAAKCGSSIKYETRSSDK